MHAMVGRRVQSRRVSPKGGDPTQAQPFTVAMDREVRIQHLKQTLTLQLGKQEGDVSDPLSLDREWFIPVISVSEECVGLTSLVERSETACDKRAPGCHSSDGAAHH